MVKLTTLAETVIYVNPAHVVHVFALPGSPDACEVQTVNGHEWQCKGSPVEVALRLAAG